MVMVDAMFAIVFIVQAWEKTTMSDQNDITYEVKLPPRELTKFERERRAFLRLLPQLLATHRGWYVAVHDEKVAASGADRMEVAMNVWKHVGGVDLYVGLVTDQPAPIARSGVVREATDRRASDGPLQICRRVQPSGPVRPGVDWLLSNLRPEDLKKIKERLK